MEEERVNRALARIEAAAARIEAAARFASAPPAAAPAMPVDSDLAHRHEALRREAWAALAELDNLIEAIER